jgi:hypothetical protein
MTIWKNTAAAHHGSDTVDILVPQTFENGCENEESKRTGGKSMVYIPGLLAHRLELKT